MARLGKFFYINGTDNLSNAHFLRVRADGGITESLGCIDTAGTLLESASYFMRPSGYKEDTVYSLIPNNSNGSLNFVRGSDAWRTEIGGLVQRTPYNLLTFSEQFENSVWTKTRCAVTTNSITSPNGTITADTVVEDTTASASHPVSRAVTFNAGSQTFSVYAKAANRSWIHIALLSTANAFAYFDLSNGTVGTIGSATTASIQSIGDGWYRCIMSATTAAGSNTLGIYPASADANNVYTGNGTDSIYIWGSQLVEGVDPLPYFPTTDRLNVPRLDYTYGTCPALLLEPQRTNLLPNQLSYNTATGVAYSTSVTDSPVIGLNSTRITKNEASGTLRYGNQICSSSALAGSTTYTISAYFKYDGYAVTTTMEYNNSLQWGGTSWNQIINIASTGVTLGSSSSCTGSVQNVGNGWYRVSVTITTGASISGGTPVSYLMQVASTLSTGQGFLQAAPQFEVGAYSTTPILTSGASATRIADFATTSTSLQSAGILGSVGNTAFYNVTIPQNTNRSGQFCATLTSGSVATNSLGLVLNTASIQVRSWFGGTGQLNYTLATNPTTLKIALSYVKSTKTIKIFVNGSLATTVSSIDFADYTQLTLHDLNSNTQTTSLFYHQIALFNSALSDSDCIALTT